MLKFNGSIWNLSMQERKLDEEIHRKLPLHAYIFFLLLQLMDVLLQFSRVAWPKGFGNQPLGIANVNREQKPEITNISHR